jgi:hypothetical protein
MRARGSWWDGNEIKRCGIVASCRRTCRSAHKVQTVRHRQGQWDGTKEGGNLPGHWRENKIGRNPWQCRSWSCVCRCGLGPSSSRAPFAEYSEYSACPVSRSSGYSTLPARYSRVRCQTPGPQHPGEEAVRPAMPDQDEVLCPDVRAEGRFCH